MDRRRGAGVTTVQAPAFGLSGFDAQGAWAETDAAAARTRRALRYFAYGSNLSLERFSRRVPDAVLEGAGALEGYVLRFNKNGMDGSAKCTVARSSAQRSSLRPALPADERRPARAGSDRGTGPRLRSPGCVDSADHGSYSAYTYIACLGAVDDSLFPFDWYLDYVIAGARQHGFPAAYVRMLSQVRCVVDPNPDRAAEHRRSVRGLREPGLDAAV